MPLNPGLLRELERGNSQPDTSSLYDTLGGVAMAAVETATNISWPGLEDIASPETRLAFETAFDETAELYSRIGFKVPTPEAYAEAGVDFSYLAREYERMQAEGLEPAVVPSGAFDVRVFEDLYEHLQAEEALSADSVVGFYMVPLSRPHWQLLNQVPESTPSIESDDSEATWTVRLIPACSESPVKKGHQKHGEGSVPHPTVSEYLTLLARRKVSGEPLFAEGQIEWLSGTFLNENDYNCAATVKIVSGWITISYNKTQDYGDHISARPAVG